MKFAVFRMERSVVKYCTDLLVLLDRIGLRQNEGISWSNSLVDSEKEVAYEKLLTAAEGIKAGCPLRIYHCQKRNYGHPFQLIGANIQAKSKSFESLPKNFSTMHESIGDVNQELCRSFSEKIETLASQVKLQGSELVTLTGLLASAKNDSMLTFVRACWVHLPSINDISLALLHHELSELKNKLST